MKTLLFDSKIKIKITITTYCLCIRKISLERTWKCKLFILVRIATKNPLVLTLIIFIEVSRLIFHLYYSKVQGTLMAWFQKRHPELNTEVLFESFSLEVRYGRISHQNILTKYLNRRTYLLAAVFIFIAFITTDFIVVNLLIILKIIVLKVVDRLLGGY